MIIPFLSVVLSGFLAVSIAQGSPACDGCKADDGGEFTNTSCIEIIANGFGVAQGDCDSESGSSCTAVPCLLSGSYSIVNKGDGPLFVRVFLNGNCLPGKTKISDSRSTIDYQGDKLGCGDTLAIKIYKKDPGDNCDETPDAGWTFACTTCSE